MKPLTIFRAYDSARLRMYHSQSERAKGDWGIAINSDPLAQEWRRYDRLACKCRRRLITMLKAMDAKTTSGKLADVVIENVFVANQQTGRVALLQLNVYADAGLDDVLEHVEGVETVHNLSRTLYRIIVDPRYDSCCVKRGIIAAISGRPTD